MKHANRPRTHGEEGKTKENEGKRKPERGIDLVHQVHLTPLGHTNNARACTWGELALSVRNRNPSSRTASSTCDNAHIFSVPSVRRGGGNGDKGIHWFTQHD